MLERDEGDVHFVRFGKDECPLYRTLYRQEPELPMMTFSEVLMVAVREKATGPLCNACAAVYSAAVPLFGGTYRQSTHDGLDLGPI